MDRLADQLADLAWNLVSETERRRQFVAQNRLATQRLREGFARQREQVQREIEQQAQQVAASLKSNTESIKRDVARTINGLQNRRVRSAADQSTQRRQFVSRVRRAVGTSLQRQRTRREWAARQHSLDVAQALQRVRRRVRELRGESERFTAAMANQLLAGRRALAAARSRIAQRAQ